MTTPARSVPLSAAEASSAAGAAATHVDAWFSDSVNVALWRVLDYRRISEYDGWLLERELNRILAVAERSLP